MALREILRFGDEILRKQSKVVEKIDERIITLIDDMHETLESVGGVGLAAPQVGVLKRIFIIHIDDKKLEFINPQIVKESGTQESIEGCLSYPGKYGITNRPLKVTIKAQNRKGKEFIMNGEELLAKAFCHENDHLNGKLYIDEVVRMLEDDEIDD